MALLPVADYSWDRPRPSELAKVYAGVVRYAPGRTDAVHLTRDEVAALRAAGLQIAVVIQPSKDWVLGGHDAGVREATRSVEMTDAAGLARGDVFVAVDFDATSGPAPHTEATLAQLETIARTFEGVASVVGQDHVRPYGGYHFLTWIYARLPWLRPGWQPAIAWSLGPDGKPLLHPNAALRQKSPSITYDGAAIDHNDVLLPDWGLRVEPTTGEAVATITVDSTTQRYTSYVSQEPDILLLHTTEVWGWPGYNGGGTAPHDTIKPIKGKGIEVRRHYPYDQFSKSLENDAGGVETNKRGVIQVELMGTCDPGRKAALYFWPEADDVVLQALADYYRPIMAKYDIPARAMAEFVAFPKSYGDNAAQRLSYTEWMNGAGICGHQHAPENAHGDPGAFPIARFIAFLEGEDMPTVQEVVDGLLHADRIVAPSPSETNPTWTVGSVLEWTNRNAVNAAAGVARLEAQVPALTAAVQALATSQGSDPVEIAAIVDKAVRDRLAQLDVELTVTDGQV